MIANNARLTAIRKIMREKVKEILGEVAEDLGNKNYDYLSNRAFTMMAADSLMAEINYAKGDISFRGKDAALRIDRLERLGYAQSSIESLIEHKGSESSYIAYLQGLLYYKPVLDKLREFVKALPDYYDVDEETLKTIKKPLKIEAKIINKRKVKGLKSEDTDKVMEFLEGDFPDIYSEYCVDTMTGYFGVDPDDKDGDRQRP